MVNEIKYKLNMDIKYEGICIPKGTMHRPIANTKTTVLMIENEGIKPIGD